MSVFYRGIWPGRWLLAVLALCGSFVLSASVLRAQARPEATREDADRQLEELERVYGEGRSGEWGSGEDVKGRQYWFEFQRRFPFDVIPAGAREAAISRMNATREILADGARKKGAALFSANQWSQIGPFDVGGRVRAIAVHPSVPDAMYIGGASGGVWKTTDAGSTWNTTFDKQTALTIGSIAIDPNSPNTVYVGTGEIRVASDVGYMADGIFKSTDGGQTWKNIGLNNLAAVSRVYVNNRNSNVVYVTAGRVVYHSRYTDGNGLGTADGFYRSTDGGSTWTRSSDVSGAILEMAVNPVNNDELLVSSTNAVFRSTDAGANFVRVTTGLNNLTTSQRMSMAYDPANPSLVYLLQAYRGSNGTHVPNIYKSTNGGVNWSFVTVPDPNFFRNQGEYNNCLIVDPEEPEVLLAGGIDLFRSTDAGNTWANISRTFGSTFDEEEAHPDQHIFVYDPHAPGVVYVGNDGGVYMSLDAGLTWDRLTSSLPITQFHAIEVDQTRPFRVFGGTQDNQSQAGLGTTSHAAEWTRLLGGDGFWVVVDLVNPDIIYAESQYGNVRRMNVNNLATKTNIVSQIDDGGAWSTPIAMSPVDFSFWTARSNVYRTADPRAQDVAWQTMMPGYGGGDATALALHPTNAQRVIVGAGRGDTRYSLDRGATWARSMGLPTRFLTDLLYDTQNENRVWATFAGFKAGHVFRSDDNGATFTDVTSTLPDVPVNAIEIDPNDSRRVFAGTDIGVFVSLDAGESWFPFNEGLPVVPVVDMRIHRSRRMLVAATHGRSVFEAPIDNIVVPATVLSPLAGATFATPGPVEVRWAGFDGPVNVFLSLRSGDEFRLVATSVSGSSTTIQLPLARSTTARIRVESVGGAQSAVSGALTLTAAANVESLGKRGFVAEAIAVRNGQLWVTSRGSDTIYRRGLPLLGSAGIVMRSGFTGTVRDLAYNPEFDHFYALVTADDFTSPRLFKMDTNGASLGEIPLPSSVTTAVGVAVGPEGLVIAPAGEGGSLTVINAMTGAEIRRIPVTGTFGADRRGLVWNGRTFTQGVFIPTEDFPSQIQQVSVGDSARLYEAIPVVLTSGATLKFFDLAIDLDGTGGQTIYFATDTAGNIYRFRGELFAGVETDNEWKSASNGVTISSVVPNPLRGFGTVELVMDRSADITLDLLSSTGEVAARFHEGRIAAGRTTVNLNASLIPSGVYYLVLTDDGGRRTVRPMAIVK